MPTYCSTPIRAGLMLLALAASAAARASAWSRLTILDRAITQDQGDWQVDYRLRHDGASDLIVTPDEISARVEGWVSNSRAASHAVPRWSSLVISGPSGLRATAEIIASADEDRRCAELAVLSIATGEDSLEESRARGPVQATSTTASRPVLSLAPGATVRVRLRLEHRHVLHGAYDPLLGARTLELSLGATTLRDALPLDHEHRVALPEPALLEAADDRRDTRHFLSAPDSLHIAAHLPGNQSYRFPEQTVRYGTKMRLRFWYLIAPGTEGECRARIVQYKDSPTAWRVLPDGRIDLPLTTVGRWIKVERYFRTESDATTLALDIRIDHAEVGELWIDDVSLTPVGTPGQNP
ncbi:MAG TPA: hypothetical protein VKP69_10460 [Isosphaeraceae bacterium]|nr:hypothetical protein [Isosphaeraceae bacterium]